MQIVRYFKGTPTTPEQLRAERKRRMARAEGETAQSIFPADEAVRELRRRLRNERGS